jgi:hypothetical protein
MVLKGAARKLLEKTILRSLLEVLFDLPCKKAIVSEILGTPVGVRVEQKTGGPKLSVPKAHSAVSPERKRGRLSPELRCGQEGSKVAGRQKRRHGTTLDLFSPDLSPFEGHRSVLLLVPSHGYPSGHRKKLAPLG